MLQPISCFICEQTVIRLVILPEVVSCDRTKVDLVLAFTLGLRLLVYFVLTELQPWPPLQVFGNNSNIIIRPTFDQPSKNYFIYLGWVGRTTTST